MFKFEETGTTINRGFSALIYADPGIGKTTLSTTLPPGETLFINTEAGLGPLLGTKHVVFNLQQSVTDLCKFEELVRYLKGQDHPFKNVVIDNISELEQWIILTLTQQRKKEFTEVKEYGDSAYKMREYIRDYRDLVYNGINVIFNAWEAPIEIKNSNGEIITKTFPKMAKKVAPEICGLVDMVGHLEVYEKTGERWLRFGPSTQYITKCQFKGLDAGEPANLPAIFKKIRDKNSDVPGPAKRTPKLPEQGTLPV